MALLRTSRIGCIVFLILFSLALVGCGSGGTSGFVQPPVTTTLTNAGGTITDGAATLTVPANATQLTTLAGIQAATSYPADARIVKGTVYTFDANGTTFVRSVTINIAYTVANLPTGAVESSLSLFKVVSGAWTQVTGSTVDTTGKSVTGTDTTLGTYAILATSITAGSTGTVPAGKALFTSDRTGGVGITNLFTMNLDGSSVTQLTQITTNNTGVDTAFYKPDGTKIVFGYINSGGTDIDLMNVDGSSQQKLLGGEFRPDGVRAHSRAPEYNATGTSIVFISDRTSTDQVFTMKPDGTSLTQLTTLTGGTISNASFTKAGLIRLAVTLNSTTTTYLMNSDGSNVTTVTAGSVSLTPWWSYNTAGTNIVYSVLGSSGYDLYIAKSDGTSPTRLTSLNATAFGKTRFSPDGTKVLFDAATSGAKATICIVGTTGAGLTAITAGTSNDRFQDVH